MRGPARGNIGEASLVDRKGSETRFLLMQAPSLADGHAKPAIAGPLAGSSPAQAAPAHCGSESTARGPERAPRCRKRWERDRGDPSDLGEMQRSPPAWAEPSSGRLSRAGAGGASGEHGFSKGYESSPGPGSSTDTHVMASGAPRGPPPGGDPRGCLRPHSFFLGRPRPPIGLPG